jgi:CopG family transcriptional regulator/antitoxin EndoAI
VAQVKRVMITMPNSLLEEVDGLARQENRNRSEFIREVVRCYIDEKRRMDLRERLRKGYLNMSQVNRELAEEGASAAEEAFVLYEEVLARSNGG